MYLNSNTRNSTNPCQPPLENIAIGPYVSLEPEEADTLCVIIQTTPFKINTVPEPKRLKLKLMDPSDKDARFTILPVYLPQAQLAH